MAHAGCAGGAAGHARLKDANSESGSGTLAGARGSYYACTENENVITVHWSFGRGSKLILLPVDASLPPYDSVFLP
jgi:hypothetical protein